MLPHLHKGESVIFLRTYLGFTSYNRCVGEYEVSEPYDANKLFQSLIGKGRKEL